MIFVTGSNGFIGKNLHDYFSRIKREDIIWGTTSSNNYNNWIRFRNNYMDLEENLYNSNIKAIIHLAADIPKSFCESDFEKVFINNATMMNNLYKFVLKNDIKKFIYVSSFGSMNNPNCYDIKDYYTLSKIHGEHVCRMMEAKGVETASLRISSPYGPYFLNRNVINLFIEKAMANDELCIHGTGKREQNFIYIMDVVKAIKLCIEIDRKLSGVYSIVSDKNTSMFNLAEVIINLTESKSKIIFAEQLNHQENYKPIYDYSRATQEIGFVPEYDIKRGLKKYIDWIDSK